MRAILTRQDIDRKYPVSTELEKRVLASAD